MKHRGKERREVKMFGEKEKEGRIGKGGRRRKRETKGEWRRGKKRKNGGQEGKREWTTLRSRPVARRPQ